eukprot:gene19495-26158_t
MIKSTVLQVLVIALLALVSSTYGQKWKAFLRKKNLSQRHLVHKSVKSSGYVVLKLEGDYYTGTWKINKIKGHIKVSSPQGPESGSGPMVWEPMGLDIPVLSGSFTFHIKQFMLNTSIISVEGLDAGAYYVNIHTNKYPDGEIRGQFRRVTE